MIRFSNFLLLIIIAVQLLNKAYGVPKTTEIFLNEECDQIYTVRLYVRIRLSRTNYLLPNQSCIISIVPLISDETVMFKLLARFLLYDLNSAYANEHGNCVFQAIQLYDATGTAQLPAVVDGGYCGSDRPTDVYDLGTSGHFQLATSIKETVTAASVDLLIMSIVDKQFSSATCPLRYFDCESHDICVSKEVVCNGFPDCTNSKDETDGCQDSNAAINGFIIAMCVFFFIFASLPVLFYGYKHRQSTTVLDDI